MVEENEQNDYQWEEVEVKHYINGADKLEKQHGYKLKDHLQILQWLSTVHSINKFANVLK
jgi:hypothetical protein